jgi:2-oxoglutarate dehydrogenase E1 component
MLRGLIWSQRCRFSPRSDLADTPPALPDVMRPAVRRFVEAHRRLGHRHAAVDPLREPAASAEMALAPLQFGLAPDDPLTGDGSPLLGAKGVLQLDARLKAIYCASLALDCSALRDEARAAWLYARMEQQAGLTPDAAQARGLLARLVQAQAWEQHLARVDAHAKRFSLEGCEALLPLLDALIDQASLHGIGEVLMGMPHRGRVNVLVNLMGMPAARVMEYFDTHSPDMPPKPDLVYHLGAQRELRTRHGELSLRLAANPSHLQSVQPVVLGMTRAAQRRAQHQDVRRALALVMHGDAAFAGQGVVMESLQLGQRPGYSVGGSIHVIINNQVGFTELNPMDGPGARHCTDAARIIDAPVLRVSADAPDQLLRAAAIAVEYRQRFGADVVIDLVGYRRLGHSEHDVPELSNPQRQARIERQASVVEVYADQLRREGRVTAEELAQTVAHAQAQAAHIYTSRAHLPDADDAVLAAPPSGAAALPTLAEVRAMVEVMSCVPQDFVPHALVARLITDWRRMATSATVPVDWCFAENLAYATLLRGGVGLRISGMDVRRGTFLHRHAVWQGQTSDASTATEFMPLRQVQTAGAGVEVLNSLLSEEAVLGFEYGYSVRDGGRQLCVWEAQFGDFANGAQVYFDQYLASGEAKWGARSALTVLLPHGYEGYGPEHSTGFLGRFLQLCAEDNLRVVCPSTSAQWFHLLRDQALATPRKPLVVMSPKGTLHGEALSHAPLGELLQGGFRPLLADAQRPAGDARVQRLLLCSGKVYFDLERERRKRADAAYIALVRVEQLYPLPAQALAELIAGYPGLREIVWAQEEQRKQGAWLFLRDELEALCPRSVTLRSACRADTAAGPCASLQLHRREQQQLVAAALGPLLG